MNIVREQDYFSPYVNSTRRKIKERDWLLKQQTQLKSDTTNNSSVNIKNDELFIGGIFVGKVLLCLFRL